MNVKVKAKLLAIRDLPGCLDVESSLILYSGRAGEISPRSESCIDQFAFRNFGISLDEASAYFSDGELETDYEMTDDEVVEYMLKINVDFRCVKGQPLRCTRSLARVVELAARGLTGRMPDLEEIALTKSEEKLRYESFQFLEKHREPN
ncbi:hypothetical protein [Methyloraptor flagellatus]|uniref:Uncharacterized protein n=1 Tax=Methyloraptor flagellatus TaxID=3162530 RepID=A0AAU7X7L1_9HYPH